MRSPPLARRLIALALAPPCRWPASAQDKVLNLYSARHYQTDEALYAELHQGHRHSHQPRRRRRRRHPGAPEERRRSSPADVILLVDAARLWRAEVDGLFQPVRSGGAGVAHPGHLRGKDEPARARSGSASRPAPGWWSTTRPGGQGTDVDTYEKLGDPKNKGKVCTRSGSHPYNLSLFGADASTWAREDRGLAQGHGRQHGARAQGRRHRPDQGRGQRRMRRRADQQLLPRPHDASSQAPADRAVVESIGVVFPNQATTARTSTSPAARWPECEEPGRGGAVPRIPRQRRGASLFCGWQQRMAGGRDTKTVEPALDALGKFKAESVPISVIGMNQVKVQQILDRVGYK
jgi:iron(III) transport system substrate-binding protein